MRTAVLVTMVVLQIIGIVSTIMMVGKKREPITPAVAVVTTFVATGMILGAFYLA